MDNLLDTILRIDNLNAAYKKVKANNGIGGVDVMQVDELLPYLRDHQTELVEQIWSEKYKLNPVRWTEITKEEKGKARKRGVPTVVDRVIQQAISFHGTLNNGILPARRTVSICVMECSRRRENSGISEAADLPVVVQIISYICSRSIPDSLGGGWP